jgi:hypothetical protein
MLKQDESETDPLTGKPKVRSIWTEALREEPLTGHDVIRLLEFPPTVFVSERFAKVFEEGGFTGAVLRPVPVISNEQRSTTDRQPSSQERTESTTDLSPTDIARSLVGSLEALHTMAGATRELDDDGEILLSIAVRGFLDCYREAYRILLPALPSYRRREPVTHAGAEGGSYHELALRLAFNRYRRILVRLQPESYLKRCEGGTEADAPQLERFSGSELTAQQILDNWPMVAQDLRDLVVDSGSISSKPLQAEIRTEAERGKN